MNELWKLFRKSTKYGFYGWIFGYLMMMRLPDAGDIDPLLLSPPVQDTSQHGEFTFHYKGHEVKGQALATYKLYGLIVSQNQPEQWFHFDVTRNSSSVNTRDICVVFGDTLKSNDFHDVRFSNDNWSCQTGLDKKLEHFNGNDVSNNHLITDNDVVRKQIHRFNNGDQVLITGKLVTYSENFENKQVHHTSLTRTDTGHDASEIILVDSVEVLHSYNFIWAWLRDICFWTFVITLIVRVVVFLMPRRWLRVPRWIKEIIRIYLEKLPEK